VGSWVFWTLFLAFGLSWPIVRTLTMDSPKRVPIVEQAGNFRLVNQYGKAWGSAELKGKVWVATMVCTECPFASPDFTRRMTTVQHRSRGLGDAFRLVTFSLDPETDIPSVLLKHAEAYKASRGRWVFLTGAVELVKQAVAQTFGREAPRQKRGEAALKGFNSEKSYVVALVDHRMQVRGYYDCRDDASIDDLMRDIGLVVNLPD
jgi:protein SCO1/2